MTAIVYAKGGEVYLGRFSSNTPSFWKTFGRPHARSWTRETGLARGAHLGTWMYIGHRFEGKHPVGVEKQQVVVFDDKKWDAAEIARRKANGLLGIKAYPLYSRSNPVGNGGSVTRFTGKLFPLGRFIMTGGVSDAIAANTALAIFTTKSLGRHASGDWGDMDPEDKKENDFSVNKELRIFSSYHLPEALRGKYPDDKVWIITEADRSVTTILWPSEY